MNVTYSEKAKQSEDYPLLERATAVLEQAVSEANKVLGRFADEVSAAWDREEDAKKGPVYVLRLSDWSGSVSNPYSADELRSGVNLNPLWRHLLKIRSHKLLEKHLNGE